MSKEEILLQRVIVQNFVFLRICEDLSILFTDFF